MEEKGLKYYDPKSTQVVKFHVQEKESPELLHTQKVAEAYVTRLQNVAEGESEDDEGEPGEREEDERSPSLRSGPGQPDDTDVEPMEEGQEDREEEEPEIDDPPPSLDCDEELVLGPGFGAQILG